MLLTLDTSVRVTSIGLYGLVHVHGEGMVAGQAHVCCSVQVEVAGCTAAANPPGWSKH